MFSTVVKKKNIEAVLACHRLIDETMNKLLLKNQKKRHEEREKNVFKTHIKYNTDSGKLNKFFYFFIQNQHWTHRKKLKIFAQWV